jgi:hypothetical protein
MGNIWNYRGAVILRKGSVSHGWLSTSRAKKSSVNVSRQQDAEKSRRTGERDKYRRAGIEMTRIV